MSQGAEAILQDGGIYISPRRNESSDFSEEILADLVAQGLSGQELLALFKVRMRKTGNWSLSPLYFFRLNA